MQRPAVYLRILIFFLGLILMRESHLSPMEGVDKQFGDWLITNSRRAQNEAPVTLVGINDASLENHPWPWAPLDFALFLQASSPFKPAVLAIENILDWEKKERPSNEEKILHEYLLKTPKILLGAKLGFHDDPQVIPPLQETPVLKNVKGSISAVPEFTMITHQAREDFRLASTIGFTNFPSTREVNRRAPLIFRYRGQIVPSFTLQAMMLWLKLTPDDIVVESGSKILMGSALRIPIDEAGTMQIDPLSTPKRVDFDELLLSAEQHQVKLTPIVPPETIQDKLVLLARTDKDSRTLTFATGQKGSPGEFIAAAIATLQNKAFIHPPPLWLEFAILAIFTVCIPWVFRFGKWTVVLISALGLTIYLLSALQTFEQTLTRIPMMLPVGLFLFTIIIRMFGIGRPASPAAPEALNKV